MPSDASWVSSRPPCGIRHDCALMKLLSLQHVSSPYPEGEDASVRRFYGEVLGLQEKPTPSTLAGMGLLWFSGGKDPDLHSFPPPTAAAPARHFLFTITDLHAP